MRSIPPAIDADAEDVVWALETADALWARQERVDAIVWLRRAAQAAGAADDDDRALELARKAAELTEWMTTNPAAGPTAALAATTETSVAGAAVDDLLLGEPSIIPIADDEDIADVSDDDETPVQDIPVDLSESPPTVIVNDPPAPPEEQPTPVASIAVRPQPPKPAAAPSLSAKPASSSPPRPAVGAGARSPSLPRPAPPQAPRAPATRIASPPPPRPQSPRPAPPSPVPPAPSQSAGRVPTAAEVHAGMLDPWAEAEAPTQDHPLPSESPPPAPPAFVAVPPPPAFAAAPTPVALAPTPPAPPASAPPPPAAAPAPPAAPAFDGDEVVTSAPPVSMRTLEARAVEAKPAAKPPPRPPKAQTPRAEPEPEPPAPEAKAAQTAQPNGVNLSNVEALSDLPDDARDAFAAAAKVESLGREDEVSGFALALVLEGEVDLAATIVDAPAERFRSGSVLRARGTIETAAGVRLIGASERARVATWGETAVSEAFRTCPWVEDDLRASGDRLQALVGITMGPLGERLDPALRADVVGRLQLRALAEHEVIATRGAPTPGLLVVGAGELELLDDDGAPSGVVLRPGEFLFPSEVLRAGAAPRTVRASSGGALILVAERGVAQELLVTCPPLLEIFAGM